MTSISRVQIDRTKNKTTFHQFLQRRREPKMRSQVLLVTFAFLAIVVAALPLAESSGRHHHDHSHVQSKGHGEGGELAAKGREARAWPCCDNCGGCTKSIPPRCQCLDAVRGGCHPACRECVKSSLSVDPPVYQCNDRVPNFCQRRCTAAAAAH